MLQKILFAIDRSVETSHAISLAVDLAKKYDSAITLLCVADTSASGDDDAIKQQRQQGQTLLEQAQTALRKTGLANVTTEYREGKVAFVICDAADDLNVDLVIIGGRGVGLTEDGREDSVSNRVINLSPCPVLVVP